MSSSSVLVINSGSSSIKYQLVDPETGDAIAKGIVERIGDTTGLIKQSTATPSPRKRSRFRPHRRHA